MTSPPRLELRGITKRFPDVLANEAVDLRVLPGEIHALLGENGAGKSTLVKIIYGVLRPDSGHMMLDGTPLRLSSPRDARRRGIAMVFQHFTLFESLSVAENLALGVDRRRPLGALLRELADTGRRFGLELDPRRPVHELSAGERQRLEILRCLLGRPRLLIMDEPTSVLAPQEVAQLFLALRRIAAAGCSVLFISHKIEEVRALCHRATVLRRGRVVARLEAPVDTPAREIVRLMVGTEVREPVRPKDPARLGPPVLELCGLSLPAETPLGMPLRELRLALRRGEILGIAGVAGNGQRELVEALSGERLAPRADMIRLQGRPVGRLGPVARRRLGLAVLPEQRLGHAAVAGLALSANALLSAWPKGTLVRHGLVRWKGARAFAAQIVDRFAVQAPGRDPPAGQLSGGNLQKFVIGRELLQDPEVLVVAQPTWGIDAASTAAVHRALARLAASGAGILLISQDLDELFLLADRIAVLHRGRLHPPRAAHSEELESIGLEMTGAARSAPAALDHAEA